MFFEKYVLKGISISLQDRKQIFWGSNIALYEVCSYNTVSFILVNDRLVDMIVRCES